MTNAPFRHFLIVFDASTCAEPEVSEFERSDAALEAYHRAEDQYRGRREIHVVLLGSDSIETIKKTHGNYWNDDGLAEIEAALSGSSRSAS